MTKSLSITTNTIPQNQAGKEITLFHDVAFFICASPWCKSAVVQLDPDVSRYDTANKKMRNYAQFPSAQDNKT